MPAGEFWLGPNHENPEMLTDDKSYGVSRLDFGQNKVTKMVASAAHIYGRKTVSAEAFTTMRHWQDSPASLKQSLDRAFCEGVNRIVIHSTTSTRPEDGLPGYEYGAGTHFNPNITWWELSSGFLTYIARCQHLLRAGMFVADVLFYNGDTAPNLVAQKHIDPRIGKGYDYDVCNEEVLLNRLLVKDGRLILPDGMSYRLLVLPASRRMSLASLKKIRELVADGATVIGSPPETDSGLKNYPQCDNEIKSIKNTLWEKPGVATPGKVLNTSEIRQVLQSKGVEPDFEYDNSEAWIDYIHRSTNEAEIYFLTNRKNSKVTTNCKFRVSGKVPELWDAVNGSILLPQYHTNGNRTTIHLSFDVFQSVFVVFPKSATSIARTGFNNFQSALRSKDQQVLEGSWTVIFDTDRGGPGKTVFEKLADWTQHDDPRIKFYSGKAVYEKVLDIKSSVSNKPIVVLDLGEVKSICRVSLNGKDLGIIWTAPWEVNLTGRLKTGKNILQIEVINLWPNRLIGDAALPEQQRITNTNIAFKKDAELMPSGLIGPVTISTF
ncbi:glycosyl hydrolase [Niabella hibiscisoli]|uniref:glycosyl hydrolase n=1 Tax=Niabella hibiscisoli TaxID=1825928 RepID=UPI0021D41F4E|nr:glycosyl hydrolase [Niabella hibiscisoli]